MQVVPPATCLAPHVLTFTLLHSLIQHLYDSFVAPYYAAFGGGEGHPTTADDVATLGRAARIGAHGIAFALRVLHENLQHSEREPGIRYAAFHARVAWLFFCIVPYVMVFALPVLMIVQLGYGWLVATDP